MNYGYPNSQHFDGTGAVTRYNTLKMNISGDFSWKHGMMQRMNSPLLPSNIRGLIIGKSNCGKTTLLPNVLPDPNSLQGLF